MLQRLPGSGYSLLTVSKYDFGPRRELTFPLHPLHTKLTVVAVHLVEASQWPVFVGHLEQPLPGLFGRINYY